MKVLLSVGEVSGDLQAELVLQKLSEILNGNRQSQGTETLEVFAVCGARLIELKRKLENNSILSSTTLKIHEIEVIENLSVMGFSDVFRSYFKIRMVFENFSRHSHRLPRL
jgi:lipid A disaccharide synthetase